MAITAGQDILASDFVATSAGAGDLGRVPKLNSSGQLDKTFIDHYYIWGDGNDGNVTITGGTTTLTRDMHYNNLTISSTGILVTNGFRVFVKGTLDYSAAGAVIRNNGSNASADVGGAGAPSGTVGGGTAGASAPFFGAGNNGGAGGGGAGVVWIAARIVVGGSGVIEAKGGNGSAASTANLGSTSGGLSSTGVDRGLGAAGGASGLTSGAAGGSGGGITAPNIRVQHIYFGLAFYELTSGKSIGGGSGGGSSRYNTSQTTNNGGGGGGGGGCIYFIYQSGTFGAESVAGGTGGAGNGTGTAGATGSTGNVIKVQIA